MTIHAVFDGKALIPEEKVELELNTCYEITIGKKISRIPQSGDLWDLLEEKAGTIEGPEDWSVEHDHYIHGTPKRSE
ncbi:MAG: hypothetical protein O7E52_07450 [Candidatus Poribacteria bacterium]|nr:hypothetical protein [Candidatus Poribacteria bacterium]